MPIGPRADLRRCPALSGTRLGAYFRQVRGAKRTSARTCRASRRGRALARGGFWLCCGRHRLGGYPRDGLLSLFHGPGYVGFIALGFGIGWLLGGPDAGTKRVMALGTGQRNIAAALVVASQSFDDPKVVVMVIVIAIVGLIILMPLSRALANRAEPVGPGG